MLYILASLLPTESNYSFILQEGESSKDHDVQIYEDPIHLDLPSQTDVNKGASSSTFDNSTISRRLFDDNESPYVPKVNPPTERKKSLHFGRSRSRLSQKQMTSSARQILDNVLTKEMKSKHSPEGATSTRLPRESNSNYSSNALSSSERQQKNDSSASWTPGWFLIRLYFYNCCLQQLSIRL